MGIFKNIVKNLTSITKDYTETTSRPAIMQPYMATDTGAKLPIFPFPTVMIQDLAKNIDALRIPIEVLNREIFKNGFEVVERFKYRCENCGKEFKYKPTLEESDELEEEKGNGKSGKPTGSGDKKENPPEKVVKGGEEETGETPDKDGGKGSDSKDGLHSEKNGNKFLTESESPDEGGLVCDSCGHTDIKRPKPENRKRLMDLYLKPINNNRQTIMEVSRMLERDLEVTDGGYMLVLRDYFIGDSGEIDWKKTKLKEIIAIEPPTAAVICDADGRLGFDDKKNPVFVCPHFEHREKRLTKTHCDVTGDGVHDGKLVRGLKAILECSSIYSLGMVQPKRVIYADSEIIFAPGKYYPGLVYGYSPIFAIWSKAMTLSHMDEYLRKYFDKMRPPRGLLVVASRNWESFQKTWRALEQKATEDPYAIYPLMVESEKGGRNLAQWLDFTGSLKELEFTEVRRELRMIIGAAYGVEPIWWGEGTNSGSQEGLEITVTNRAIKWGQDFLAHSFYRPLAEMMGIDDWDIRLKLSEETDKLREYQIEAAQIQNMATLQQMGFEVERTHDGGWKVSKKPTNFSMMQGGNDGGFGDKQGKGKPGTGRGNSLTGNKEQQQTSQGEHKGQRPSDKGGVAGGHPSSDTKGKGGLNHSKKEYIDEESI